MLGNGLSLSYKINLTTIRAYFLQINKIKTNNIVLAE